jgi:hypothetical protein
MRDNPARATSISCCIKHHPRSISVKESLNRRGPVREFRRIRVRKSLALFINSN